MASELIDEELITDVVQEPDEQEPDEAKPPFVTEQPFVAKQPAAEKATKTFQQAFPQQAFPQATPSPEQEARKPGIRTVVALPVVQKMSAAIARVPELQQLGERLAPLAMVDNHVRLGISGCRPGDGASTVATALAMDMSQRLGLPTLLVDAHLRNPALHRFFAMSGNKAPEVELNGWLQIRSTGWPGLELANCCLTGSLAQRRELLDQLETLLDRYPAAVIDLGVARLDARMLPVSRPTDPMLLVVRYGHTERQELANTAAALRAANRAVAGVILNCASGNPVNHRNLISARI